MNLLEKLKMKLTPLPIMTNEEIADIQFALKNIISERVGMTAISKFWIHKYFTEHGSRVNHNLAMYLRDANFVCIHDESKNEKNSVTFIILQNKTNGINIVKALASEVVSYASELNNKIGDKYICIPDHGSIKVVKMK